MSEELHGVEEIAPFTREDLEKCREIFKQHRLTRSELYGDWLAETAEDKALRELAEQYHEQCEAYDRTVCTGISPRTGDAMPLTHNEMRLINRHALEMRDTIIKEGRRLGFSREQVEQAIQEYRQ